MAAEVTPVTDVIYDNFTNYPPDNMDAGKQQRAVRTGL